MDLDNMSVADGTDMLVKQSLIILGAFSRLQRAQSERLLLKTKRRHGVLCLDDQDNMKGTGHLPLLSPTTHVKLGAECK